MSRHSPKSKPGDDENVVYVDGARQSQTAPTFAISLKESGSQHRHCVNVGANFRERGNYHQLTVFDSAVVSRRSFGVTISVDTITMHISLCSGNCYDLTFSLVETPQVVLVATSLLF